MRASWIAGASAMLLASTAYAQEAPRDATHPSVTKRPFLAESSPGPEYPIRAMRNLLEGESTLSLCVDARGYVTSRELSGSSGHEELDRATLEWAKGARFRPAEVNGVPVAVCNYKLANTWKIDGQTKAASYRKLATLPAHDRPQMLKAGPPQPYPKVALEHRIAEKVVLSLCIGPDGVVDAVTFENLKGNASLATATVKWAMASEFKPGVAGGKQVGVCGLKVEYDWKLPE